MRVWRRECKVWSGRGQRMMTMEESWEKVVVSEWWCVWRRKDMWQGPGAETDRAKGLGDWRRLARRGFS